MTAVVAITEATDSPDTTDGYESPTLVAALGYAERGYHVFPLRSIDADGKCSCSDPTCKNIGKHPAVSWSTVNTTDPDRIRTLWITPNAGIGIACGPSGIGVLDVDPKNGGDASLGKLRERIGAEHFETPTVRSGGGGSHYYFRLSKGVKVASLGEAFGPTYPGLDTRGEGGYIVAAPSLHKSGHLYEWVPGRGLDDIEMLPFPDPLRQLLQDAARKTSVTNFEPGKKIANGKWNATLTSIAGSLRNLPLINANAIFATLQIVNAEQFEEPLPVDEVASVSRSVERYAPKNALGNANFFSAEPIDLAGAFIPALDLDFTDDEREVFVDGMIWRGELHVLYGAGGIGKTGLACKFLALITQKHYDVAVVVSEDKPQDVFKRIVAAGGIPERVFIFDERRGRIVLPDAESLLHQFLLQAKLGALYFDSVMDHRNPDMRRNAADDARGWAGPLQRLASATNTAIIATCHKNAAGTLEGAQQIRNKARCVIHLAPAKEGTTYTTRSGERIGPFDKATALVATSEKANRGRAGSEMVFQFLEVPSLNPNTGEVDSEKREDGTIGDRRLFVCDRMDHVQTKAERAKADGGTIADFAGASRGRRGKRDPQAQLLATRAELVEWLREHPGKKTNDDLIGSGIVTDKTIASVLDDPMFDRTTEGRMKYAELSAA